MSWEQLRDIYRQADQEARDEQAAPPTACPNDGTRLDVGPGGVRHCPFCGWTDN